MIVLLVPLQQMYDLAQREPAVAHQSVINVIAVFGVIVEFARGTRGISAVAGYLGTVIWISQLHLLRGLRDSAGFEDSYLQYAKSIARVLQVIEGYISCAGG